MMRPKIKFEVLPLKNNIEEVEWAYFDGSKSLNSKTTIIEYFNELRGLESLKKAEIKRKIVEIVGNYYDERKKDLEMEKERYQKLWDEYNDKFFKSLTDYLDISWPKNNLEIRVFIGLILISPRFLESFSFYIPAYLKDEDIIETCAHESLHFLWFTKWKTLYPKCDSKEFESPHPVWRYSEMVVDPILNDKIFSHILKAPVLANDDCYNILDDDDKNAFDYIKRIYASDIPISRKIIIGFKYLEEHCFKDEGN